MCDTLVDMLETSPFFLLIFFLLLVMFCKFKVAIIVASKLVLNPRADEVSVFLNFPFRLALTLVS